MTHFISAALVIAVSLTATAAAAQGARQLPTAGGMAAGYSGARASTGAPTDFSLRDPSGNLIIVNGQLKADAGFEPGYGASSGGGFGQTAVALGNQLTVQAAPGTSSSSTPCRPTPVTSPPTPERPQPAPASPDSETP
jgi:hypothetical protein